MIRKNCFIFNYAPHYRYEIFKLIDSEIEGDFYFGDKTYTQIKKIEYLSFNNFIKELRFIKVFRRFYFLLGQSLLSFKNYDNYIITGQPYNLSSWTLLFFNKILGKKSFIWNHGWYGNESGTQKILKKLQFSLIDGYFTYGNYAKKIMISEGLKPEKIHVIYNSLSYSVQLKLRSKLVKTDIYKNFFKNDYPVLFFIGRLTKVKKLHLLISAMKESFSKGMYYNLVFIGDGEESKLLKKMSMDLDLSGNIWFYGKCYQEDKIGELVYNANLCVSPGNIGLTAIHSLTYGCPSITHNDFTKQMPEFEAIVKNKTGDFFEVNNAESLSLTINNWLKNFPVKTDNQIVDCYKIIDTLYNPINQLVILKKVLR